MNRRQEILKAADSIEKNPDLFNWGSTRVPDSSCGTPGCALGWIAYHRRGDAIVGRNSDAWVGYNVIGVESWVFYDRMVDICGDHKWKQSPNVCAIVLRKYADKYHPAQKGLPESVLSIVNFEQRVAA